MWFEIIPCFAIIALSLAFPTFCCYPMNWLVVGNCYRRSMLNSSESLQYLRDWRLKDPYKVLGLENLPDEENEDSSNKTPESESNNKGEDTN